MVPSIASPLQECMDWSCGRWQTAIGYWWGRSIGQKNWGFPAAFEGLLGNFKTDPSRALTWQGYPDDWQVCPILPSDEFTWHLWCAQPLGGKEQTCRAQGSDFTFSQGRKVGWLHRLQGAAWRFVQGKRPGTHEPPGLRDLLLEVHNRGRQVWGDLLIVTGNRQKSIVKIVGKFRPAAGHVEEILNIIYVNVFQIWLFGVAKLSGWNEHLRLAFVASFHARCTHSVPACLSSVAETGSISFTVDSDLVSWYDIILYGTMVKFTVYFQYFTFT